MSDTPRQRGTLRDRTRRAMRDEVSAVATRLFAEQGCDNTTVEQIAAEAGLSRTTFFRYFGTKEDVVLTWLEDLGPGLAAAFAARPAGEHAWVSLRRAFDVLLEINADAPERALTFQRMLKGNPTMMARYRDKQQKWEDLLVAAWKQPRGAGDPVPRALVASAIACLNASFEAWEACDGTVAREELLDRAMNALAAVGTATET
ncbi:TetR family transcriptional regulator [Paractinoplanes deccanensis]|uniref:TetR family transcriptional regulator n=1 Tax=Paractinoplanes deccanensis TaxID=113561 RepID=A0ABQ3XYV9_9ACTN|nr:TetR family transcriptional regulator [Actinoplanes deccanensis]GID72924.1 TetR family transcriptional regulator [Actinoplanes deccanensis]